MHSMNLIPMIRIVLSLIICCFVSKPVFTQDYLGISGGAGLANEVGVRAAAVGEFKINNFFSLQPEISFVQRLNKDILRVLEPNIDYRQASVEYLEWSVLSKFSLSIETFHLFALIGPKAGYGLNLKANFIEDDILITRKLSFTDQGIGRFDWGINVGAGVEKKIRKGRKIFIDYRYYLGLKDLNEHSETAIFNQGAMLNLGLLIPIINSKEK